MNEIENKLKQIIEKLESSMTLADSINKKLDLLLEAVTKKP